MTCSWDSPPRFSLAIVATEESYLVQILYGEFPVCSAVGKDKDAVATEAIAGGFRVKKLCDKLPGLLEDNKAGILSKGEIRITPELLPFKGAFAMARGEGCSESHYNWMVEYSKLLCKEIDGLIDALLDLQGGETEWPEPPPPDEGDARKREFIPFKPSEWVNLN